MTVAFLQGKRFVFSSTVVAGGSDLVPPWGFFTVTDGFEAIREHQAPVAPDEAQQVNEVSTTDAGHRDEPVLEMQRVIQGDLSNVDPSPPRSDSNRRMGRFEHDVDPDTLDPMTFDHRLREPQSYSTSPRSMITYVVKHYSCLP